MGVHGLLKLLASRSLQQEEVLKTATTLIVDANGYGMFLAEKFFGEGLSRSTSALSVLFAFSTVATSQSSRSHN